VKSASSKERRVSLTGHETHFIEPSRTKPKYFCEAIVAEKSVEPASDWKEKAANGV